MRDLTAYEILEPKFAILDETDWGDDAASIVSGVNSLAGDDLGVLVITHYQRMLNLHLKPQFIAHSF